MESAAGCRKPSNSHVEPPAPVKKRRLHRSPRVQHPQRHRAHAFPQRTPQPATAARGVGGGSGCARVFAFLACFSGIKKPASAYSISTSSSCFLLSKEKRIVSAARAVASGVGSRLRAGLAVVVPMLARIRAPTPLAGWRFLGACQHPRPGCAPGGAVTCSFAQKKSHQKKGAPTVCAPALALRGTCGARFGRGLAKLAFGSDNASPDPPKAVLLGAYRWGPRERDRPGAAGHRAGRELGELLDAVESPRTPAGTPTQLRALGTMGRCAPPIPHSGSPSARRRGAQRVCGLPPWGALAVGVAASMVNFF